MASSNRSSKKTPSAQGRTRSAVPVSGERKRKRLADIRDDVSVKSGTGPGHRYEQDQDLGSFPAAEDQRGGGQGYSAVFELAVFLFKNARLYSMGGSTSLHEEEDGSDAFVLDER